MTELTENHGIELYGKNPPRKYPLTASQQLFREVLAKCNVKKGMTKADMMQAMKICIPEEYKKVKQEGQHES